MAERADMDKAIWSKWGTCVLAALMLVALALPCASARADGGSILLSVMESVFDAQARTTEGDAYAVLTNDGEFVLFRSTEPYDEASMTDVTGVLRTGVIFSGVEDAWKNPPWWSNREDILSFEVADGQLIQLKSCSNMFYRFKNVTSINLRGIDTSQVTNMHGMFNSMYDFAGSISLSGLDTSKVTDMSFMFGNDWCITSIDLGGLTTFNVTDMEAMFGGCKALKTLDVSSFDVANVTNFERMFNGCSNLTTIY